MNTIGVGEAASTLLRSRLEELLRRQARLSLELASKGLTLREREALCARLAQLDISIAAARALIARLY